MNEPISQYAAIVSLLVRHSYFAGGVCRDLAFEPDADTVTLMRQERLLLKATDSGFTLVAEMLPGLPRNDNLALRFNAFAGDPLFPSFTGEVQELGMPLHFGADAGANGTLQAHAMPAAASLAKSIERQRRPAFVVDLVLTPQDFQNSSRSVYVPARSFTIELHTRALHWKYLFFGELARHDLYIEDTDPENPVTFSECNEPLVNSGKALISRRPLPMGQEPQQRLQLKDRNSAGRVLIRRLPNASMKKIGKSRRPDGADEKDGKDGAGVIHGKDAESVYVAEIYVNQ